MKKIKSILLAFLILASTFAGAIAAVSGEESSVEVTELTESEVSEEEINEVSEELQSQYKNKRFGFAKVWKGHGWLDNGEEGYMIEGFWIAAGAILPEKCSDDSDCTEDEFCEFTSGKCESPGICTSRPNSCIEIYRPVCGCDGETYSNDCKRRAAGVSRLHTGACTEESTNNTLSEEGYSYVKAFGRLYLLGDGKYKLIRKPSDKSIESAASVEFYVIPIAKKQVIYEDAAQDSIGTLELARESQYSKFTKWTGTLTFEDGYLEGSWDVELGTTKRTIRARKLRAVKAIQKNRIASKVAKETGESYSAEKGVTDSPEQTGKQQGRKASKPIWKRFLFWIK